MTDSSATKTVEVLDRVAIRFAGDSGDGMQLVGTQFTVASALMGNQLATLPDYPAEIRAPAGTVGGVSGFQIQISSGKIHTPGDIVQVLVAMNPAALKVNLPDLDAKGIIIANENAFTERNLKLAKYDSNPLADGSLDKYRVYAMPMTDITLEAVKETGLPAVKAERCKNLFALGVVCWLFDRSLEPIFHWLGEKFAKQEAVRRANELALRAGYDYGEATGSFQSHYQVKKADLEPGLYRKVRGNEATALGLIAAAYKAGKTLFYGSYPITPASEILHELARHKSAGVKTFQAEDEIAAMCAVIGAAYGGAFAATGTSGPGMSLKSEAIGLAVMLELPCVIVNVQRGGPSTGLPTKPEQSDLYQALWGRHGECPLPVIAAQSPSDCFYAAFEAFRIAARYMTPVVVLTDGYLANGSEPWKIADADSLPEIHVEHPTNPEGFQPYSRNSDLARPWAIPGTPGLAHRIGGLEKLDKSGAVSYIPMNHEVMSNYRQAKVDKVVEMVPDQELYGEPSGELLVVSWGGAYGAVRTAVEQAHAKGLPVTHMHMRYLNPMPKNTEAILRRFKKILVPETNMGQLRTILQARYLIPTLGCNKMQGKPFNVSEVLDGIEKALSEA